MPGYFMVGGLAALLFSFGCSSTYPVAQKREGPESAVARDTYSYFSLTDRRPLSFENASLEFFYLIHLASFTKCHAVNLSLGVGG